MAIQRSRRPVAATRLAAAARGLLDASTLCAISTVASRRRAYVNTAYFAWSADFDLVWISEPHARHSRNIRARPTAAIAVYDSRQTWDAPDRGIQLFGSAREIEAADAEHAETIYAGRFRDYRHTDRAAYRLYAFRPCRLKLFDEDEFGPGTFVTARVVGVGRLAWERTEIYRPES